MNQSADETMACKPTLRSLQHLAAPIETSGPYRESALANVTLITFLALNPSYGRSIQTSCTPVFAGR